MKMLLAGLLLTCLVLAIVSTSLLLRPSKIQDNPVIQSTVEVAGIQISLAFPKSVFSPSEPIPCRIVFEDRREQAEKRELGPMRIVVRAPEVNGPAGWVPLTGLACAVFHRPPQVKLDELSRQGAGLEFPDLAQLCDMTLDGPYDVKVVFEVPVAKDSWTRCVMSSPAKLIVRSPPEYRLVEKPVALSGAQAGGQSQFDLGPPVHGMQLTLCVPHETFSMGEGIVCNLVLKNTGRNQRAFPNGDSLAGNFVLSVSRIGGEGSVRCRMAPTALGRTMLTPAPSEARTDTWTFGPGKGYTLTIRALNRLFDMPGPGLYEVQATALVRDQEGLSVVSVPSNLLRIRIGECTGVVPRPFAPSDSTSDSQFRGASR